MLYLKNVFFTFFLLRFHFSLPVLFFTLFHKAYTTRLYKKMAVALRHLVAAVTLVTLSTQLWAPVAAKQKNADKDKTKIEYTHPATIEFHKWPEALTVAKQADKPIFMFIHKTWCNACVQLRRILLKSAEYEALASFFVMADVEDDDEPVDEEYSPHGSYSPRILFLHPDGTVADVVNEYGDDPAHPHFFGNADEVVRGMLSALKVITGVTDINDL